MEKIFKFSGFRVYFKFYGFIDINSAISINILRSPTMFLLFFNF